MDVEIKDAPAPGWYLPTDESRPPYLWTGSARVFRRRVEGQVFLICKHDSGPQVAVEWQSERCILDFDNPSRYCFARELPKMWRGQYVLEVAKEAEARAGNPCPPE